MTPSEVRLSAALALGAPMLLLLAALSALPPPNRLWRACRLALCGLAVLCPLTGVALADTVWAGRALASIPLYEWSPLGLYGVRLAVAPDADGFLLAVPSMLLALSAAWTGGGETGASRLGRAASLAALAGAAGASLAGDLLSLYAWLGAFLLGSAGLLWCVAGRRAACRRVLAGAVGSTGLLVAVLVLGKVNGLFDVSQLSTSGFTTAEFAGLLLMACIAGAIPPFHGWVLRCARHPLAPALGAAGTATALTLLLLAFQVSAGEFAPEWQAWLAVLGWLAAAIGTAVALTRRAPPLRIAGVLAGRAGVPLLAASVATPAAMAAALLYVLVTTPFLALWWRLAQRAPRGARVPPGGRRALMREPGFWLAILLLACAAGLPGTAGGVARGAVTQALTSAPSGNGLHRIPLLSLDASLLVAAGGELWRRPWPRWVRGRSGWALLLATAALVCAPAAAPVRLVGSWFGPAAARAGGTVGVPLTLAVTPLPALLSGLLGVLALLALVQALRGREWLPAGARVLVGVLTLGWAGAARRWRTASAAHEALTAATVRRAETLAAAVMRILRPVEERYYAAGAVTLAMAIIYIISR